MLTAFAQNISQPFQHIVGTMNTLTANLEQSSEITKASLERVIQQAEKLNSKISDNLQGVVSNSVNHWTQDHPMIAWAITHPLLFFGLTILTFLLLRLILGAIADLIQEALKESFKRGGQKIFKLIPYNDPGKRLALNQDGQEQNLTRILQRLEALGKEQDELLSELRLVAISKR
jgi:predicted PurR-regulated permease PerM